MPQIQTTVVKSPRRGPQLPSTGTREAQPEQLPATSDVDAQVQSRIFGFLAPLAMAVLPQVTSHVGKIFGKKVFGKKGGGIGASIGKLAGGLFGRDGTAFDDVSLVEAELRSLVQQQQLAQTVMHLTQQCTPAIMDTLKQAMEDHTARGGSEDLDDQAMEGTWGLLASVITEQCIAAAPDAIRAATRAMSGGIVGSRDIDQEPLLLVDTEINQRFTMPSLSAILSAVQQGLPQLIKLCAGHGHRAISRDTGISWQDLETTKRFSDNDNISIKSISPIDNPDEIEIVLELAPHKTWWKGIEVQDDTGGFVTEIEVEDDNKVAAARIPAQLLLSPGGYLIFKKASAFGVHTGMYRLAAGGLDQLKGQQVHFYWYAD